MASTPSQREDQQALALPDAPGIEKGWEILTVSDDRARGKFTADQLAANEAKRDSVLRMLAEGMSISATARAHGMSRNTVLAAARRWGAQIEQRKQSLGADCLDVARLAVERIRDEIGEMPKASLAIIAGIMVDKGQLLLGAPTVRVEHVEAGAASYNEWLTSIIDVAAQPVAQGDDSPNKGSSAERALPAAVLALALPCAPVGDTLSPVNAPLSEARGANAPTAGQTAPTP